MYKIREFVDEANKASMRINEYLHVRWRVKAYCLFFLFFIFCYIINSCDKLWFTSILLLWQIRHPEIHLRQVFDIKKHSWRKNEKITCLSQALKCFLSLLYSIWTRIMISTMRWRKLSRNVICFLRKLKGELETYVLILKGAEFIFALVTILLLIPCYVLRKQCLHA